MRFDLKVPFAEKDAAKKLGARWDAARKLWYVLGDAESAARFAKWSPSVADPSAPAPAAAPRAPAKAREASSGKVLTGALYVEQTQQCACPPWESCEQCRTPD